MSLLFEPDNSETRVYLDVHLLMTASLAALNLDVLTQYVVHLIRIDVFTDFLCVLGGFRYPHTQYLLLYALFRLHVSVIPSV